MPFRKVLVANRGEIAVRIIRALREAGVPSVAVYSDADRTSLHVRMADEAIHIGPSPSAESYLDITRIVDAAKRHNADAVHPGYGFLSENAGFAAACETAGLAFIGPPAASIRLMGSKTEARRVAASAGVPILSGTHGITELPMARAAAATVGYPVMIKASAGGGGKGMRRVFAEAELEGALRDASSEALRAFGNPELYLEKLIETPRHVEIQVLADGHGNVIHLGERECSLQRRHQKVIEECPSPMTDEYPSLRQCMGEAAVRVARAAGYSNAGTVEFLVDPAGTFYFLEMNTRLQVEHPVTELVTGVDLVQWQLRIAAGQRLTLEQDQLAWSGHAIECRLYAEDADNDFFPSPGSITALQMPSGPGVRVDSGVYSGWTVPIDYDPLLAKISVWAGSRDLAIDRILRAMGETHVGGIRTNVGFFRNILADSEFREARLHTGFIDQFLRRRHNPNPGRDRELAAAVVAALADGSDGHRSAARPARVSKWLLDGRGKMLR